MSRRVVWVLCAAVLAVPGLAMLNAFDMDEQSYLDAQESSLSSPVYQTFPPVTIPQYEIPVPSGPLDTTPFVVDPPEMTEATVAVVEVGPPPVPSATIADAVGTVPAGPVASVSQSAGRGAQLQITDTLPPPEVPHYETWLRLAECESGGDWSIDTGNGYYGGLQFALASWRGVGGVGFPHHASEAEQMYRAELLLEIQGWGAWPSCSRELGLR